MRTWDWGDTIICDLWKDSMAGCGSMWVGCGGMLSATSKEQTEVVDEGKICAWALYWSVVNQCCLSLQKCSTTCFRPSHVHLEQPSPPSGTGIPMLPILGSMSLGVEPRKQLHVVNEKPTRFRR